MSDYRSLNLAIFLFLLSGCSSSEEAYNACIGSVDAQEAFPFREAWTGTAMIDSMQVPVRVDIETTGPVEKPEISRSAESEYYCAGKRSVPVSWVITIGDSFRHEFDLGLRWNEGEQAIIQVEKPKYSSVSALAPSDAEWPADCSDETRISTSIVLVTNPEALDLTLEWVSGSNCRVPLVNMSLEAN